MVNIQLFWTFLLTLSDEVSKEVVKRQCITLNTKVNNLERKIPDVSNLIQTNQYNTDKQNLEKKNGDVKNKIPDITGLATTAVFNTKIGEAGNKIPGVSCLANIAVLNTKIGEVEKKILILINQSKSQIMTLK